MPYICPVDYDDFVITFNSRISVVELSTMLTGEILHMEATDMTKSLTVAVRNKSMPVDLGLNRARSITGLVHWLFAIKKC